MDINLTAPCNELFQNCTTTLSSYIEYQTAYEYVISDKSTSFFLYAVTECSNEEITLMEPFDGMTLDRKDLGIIAVVTDLTYMTMFLFFLWSISYFVRVDTERHKQLLFETSEFSVSIGNLPRLTKDYTIEQMKAELWDHMQTVVKEQPQQI